MSAGPNASIPTGLRICEVCGDLAWGVCPTCEDLAARYDARYHAARAAELFDRLPRDLKPDDGIAWDGLGGLRAAGIVLRCTLGLLMGAAAFAVMLGLALGWWTR